MPKDGLLWVHNILLHIEKEQLWKELRTHPRRSRGLEQENTLGRRSLHLDALAVAERMPGATSLH